MLCSSHTRTHQITDHLVCSRSTQSTFSHLAPTLSRLDRPDTSLLSPGIPARLHLELASCPRNPSSTLSPRTTHCCKVTWLDGRFDNWYICLPMRDDAFALFEEALGGGKQLAPSSGTVVDVEARERSPELSRRAWWPTSMAFDIVPTSARSVPCSPRISRRSPACDCNHET